MGLRRLVASGANEGQAAALGSQKGDQAGKIQEWEGSKQPRGYTPFVRACIEACAKDKAPPISNADTLRAVKVVYAIYEAAAKNKPIRLE